MSEVNPQYILSTIARDKLKSHGLISQDLNNPDMDYVKPLPFPQPYLNNNFDIIPVQFNSEEFVVYLGFYEDIAAHLYFQTLKIHNKDPDKAILLLACKEWIKQCIDESTNTIILPNSWVRNWMMSEIMGLREKVITDINQLWSAAKKNPIMMQNYLDSQKEEMDFEDLTLENYVVEMINQRVERLEIFDEDVQTYMNEETTKEETEKITEETTEETTENATEQTTKKKSRKKTNHYKKKKSKGGRGQNPKVS